MEPDNQKKIKEIAEANGNDTDKKVIVVLGASDLEGALISAETVTSGDPSFAGPLAGVSLGLPVYHILEPEVKAVVPENVYQENIGIWELAVEPERLEKIGQELKALREKAQANA